MTKKTIISDVSGTPQQIEFEIAGRQKISLPYLESIDTEVETYLRASIDTLDDAKLKTVEINADPQLSDIGKTNKLRPIYQDLIETIAGCHVALGQFELRLKKREADFYAVPELAPGNSVAAMQEYEIRGWWREQPYQARLDMIHAFKKGEGDLKKLADLERIQLALMRSPVALVDAESKLANEAWRELRDQVNPAQAAALKANAESLEWGQRGLKITAGLATILTGYKQHEVLDVIVNCKIETKRVGYGIFGINDMYGRRALELANERAARLRAA